MKNFSMPGARRMLRAAVERMEPAAVEYIDWTHFEGELEKAMAVTDVSKGKVAGVFAKAVTRTRQRYRNAVMTGDAFDPRRRH